MCLSTVYELRGGEQKIVAESVSSLSVSDGLITFTDIIGMQSTLRGTISKIDLVKGAIFVDADALPA